MNTGEIRQALAAGDIGRASILSDALLASRPDDIDAMHLASVIAHFQGDTKRAIALLTRAARSTHDPGPSLGLGQLLRESGQIGHATEYFRRAVAIDPALYDARLALAHALYQGGDLIGAEEHLRHAVALRPDAVEAHELLLMVLHAEARHEEAKHLASHLQRARPSDGRRVCMALLMPAVYESREHIDRTRAELAAGIDDLLNGPPLAVACPVREIAITPFYLAYHGLNDCDLQRQIARLCRKAYRPAHRAPLEPRRRENRIRVGFVSEHFNNHSVGRVNRGYISRLRRDMFEVTVFSLASADDALARKIRAECDHHVALGGEPLAKIEQVIAGREMDILFFTDVGMDPLTYFLAYSRLAPLQCVGWGHPDTTGIDTLDVFVSADALEVPDAQSHYTEKLARLPAWVMPGFQRPHAPEPLKPRESFGIHGRTHLYVCPQQPFKIHPDFDDTIAAILRSDPHGEVVLVGGQHSHTIGLLNARFARTIPDVIERIRVLPRLGWMEYLNLIAVSDVMLDPFHFGGGLTTYDGLALGVPIVTLPPPFVRGRQAFGCYLRMGINDCIASTPRQYAEIAVSLGSNRDFRESVRARIVEQHDVLFDNYESVSALETFFEQTLAAGPAKGFR